jgi:hypothetical protein
MREQNGKPGDGGAYEVGYCKPPRAHQWKRGQSGNPKGRARGSRNFDYAKAHAEIARMLGVR